MAGMPVVSELALDWQSIRLKIRGGRVWRKLVIPGLALIGIISLLLPWIYKWQIRGYEFFLRQKPLNITNGIPFYKVDPVVFNELRIQVIVSCVFLCLAAWLFVTPQRRSGFSVVVLRGFALVILILAANLVTYLILIYYNSPREVVPAVLSMLIGNRGDFTGPRGLPLVFQQPMYGFYIFLFCNLAVAVLILITGVPHSSSCRRARSDRRTS